MENKEEKLQKIYKIIMLLVLTAFLTFLATSIGIYEYLEQGKSTKFIVLNSDLGNLNLNNSGNSSNSKSSIATTIKAIQSIIDKYYLGEQDNQKMVEGAIKGYVDALEDEYTEYITVEEMKDYQEQLLGNYVGIGIYMTSNTDYNLIQVLAPIKDSPAYEAGILPGDLILSVDGVEYKATDMTVAANNIKGKEGTKVKVKILRNEKEEIEYELTRRKVITNPVEQEILENNVGYLAITSFDEGTAEDFKKKYEELKSKNIKSLIIDLRNNGGGLVSDALEIAEYIIEKDKTLLITVDKYNNEEITKSKQNPIINIPVVVLVNENTASASEILAGALKDNNKATIIGTKTYGKGVIQQLLTLTNGGGLKLTVEEYFTPKRSKIHKIGIEPDEIVELPESVESPLVVERKDDTQLNRALQILNKK